MTDPFQNVDSMGDDFVQMATTVLENRAVEEHVSPIINDYLSALEWPSDGLHVEVGSGSGAITRLMAERAANGTVIGIDPSEGLTNQANSLKGTLNNLHFEVGDGKNLRFESGSVDNVVMHTVLSHVPDPSELLQEANRILKVGGRLVVCDADFEKSRLGNFAGDPLNACAVYFVQHYVTQPYLISDIRRYAKDSGFNVEVFRVTARPITDTDAGLAWIKFATNRMIQRGEIGESLALSFEAEYVRRKEAGTLYGFQPFGNTYSLKRIALKE